MVKHNILALGFLLLAAIAVRADTSPAITPVYTDTISFYSSNKPLAVIHPDGRVTLYGEPNAAARAFWAAVRAQRPKCESVKPGTP